MFACRQGGTDVFRGEEGDARVSALETCVRDLAAMMARVFDQRLCLPPHRYWSPPLDISSVCEALAEL